jgi:hypothetical protein
MKFFSIATIASLIATTVSVQGISIGTPANGAQIKAGHEFKVEVIEPVHLCIVPSFHLLTGVGLEFNRRADPSSTGPQFLVLHIIKWGYLSTYVPISWNNPL